ncbi:Uncharacterised protein [Vibrio cholerae]|nr:Uncharacterised protein [Vibrio cholerae]
MFGIARNVNGHDFHHIIQSIQDHIFTQTRLTAFQPTCEVEDGHQG